jgi:hypothetical protein
MKRLILILAIIPISIVINAQQFSFKLYFQDAIGNKDTLTIGYDNNGTDTIDVGLGETNIISSPLATSIDVRITNEWIKRSNFSKATFHTKKQIIKNKCGSWFSTQTIDIYSQNWPVTASWDSSLFNNSCRNGSFFTSITPGGWWDTGSPSDLARVELKQRKKVTFTSNSSNFLNPNYEYKNELNQIISVFWQLFGDSSMLKVGINDIQPMPEISIYPNPTQNYLTIQLGREDSTTQFQLNTISGQELPIKYYNNNIDIEHLPDGLYFLTLKFHNEQILRKKITKYNAR